MKQNYPKAFPDALALTAKWVGNVVMMYERLDGLPQLLAFPPSYYPVPPDTVPYPISVQIQVNMGRMRAGVVREESKKSRCSGTWKGWGRYEGAKVDEVLMLSATLIVCPHFSFLFLISKPYPTCPQHFGAKRIQA